jgi:very-short-patch-repair endonuclease
VRDPEKTDRARELRKRQTEAERCLWRHLRDHQLAGRKFRRQHPIGEYFADFVSLEDHLVVEADGGHHATQTEEDLERTRSFERQGFRVLRFWNHDILQQTEGVLQTILLSLPPTPPSPRFAGGGSPEGSTSPEGSPPC